MIRLIYKIICLFIAILILDISISYFLQRGLNKLYGLNSGARVLCIGHSRTLCGIDQDILQRELGVSVAKYAIRGADSLDRLAMLKHFLSEQSPNQTKIVVYDVDLLTFNGPLVAPEVTSAQYKQLYPFLDNEEINSFVRDRARARSEYSEYLIRNFLRLLRYSEPFTRNLALISNFKRPRNGSTRMTENLLRQKIDENRLKMEFLRIDKDHVQAFEDTIAIAKRNHIRLVLNYMPFVDMETSRYDVSYRNMVMSMLRKYADENDNIILLTTNTKYQSRYDLYSDEGHFNSYGQRMATESLADNLKKYGTTL